MLAVSPESSLTPQPLAAAPQDPLRKQIRGSALLLSGRGFAILINLATQVVIVRALAKADYGALAYVLSLVEMLSIGVLVALDKTVLRFGAIYHEKQDHSRFAGALVLSMAVPVLLGLSAIPLLALGGTALTHWLALDSTSTLLLLVAAFLVPANGVACVALSVITVAQGARSVFFRRHLLSPLIKLSAVSVTAAVGAGPLQFTIALLVAACCGLVADLWLVARIVIAEKLWPYCSPRRIQLPVREFASYSLPVLASDLAFMARGPLLIVLLGWLGTAEETASLRAILPVAKLNELVLLNFMVLFVPMASRLLAVDKLDKLWAAHAQTNLWITTLSFPMFAASVALARPMTVLLFGSVYSEASLLLVILASGYFVQAMYGMDGHLLRVLGCMRLLLAVDIAGGVILMLGASWLTRYWGALGAASAASMGILLHGHLRALSLRYVANVQPAVKNRMTMLMVALAAIAVTCVSIYWSPGWIGGTILAVIASLVVLFVVRERLDVDNTFPELRKLPFSRWLLRPLKLTGTSDFAPRETPT